MLRKMHKLYEVPTFAAICAFYPLRRQIPTFSFLNLSHRKKDIAAYCPPNAHCPCEQFVLSIHYDVKFLRFIF